MIALKELTMKILSLLILSVVLGCSSNQKETRSPTEKKADLHFTQGTKELIRGEYHHALKNLLLSAKYRPEDSKTQNNLGMAYFYRKSPSNAINHLQKAVNIDPENQDARLNLGSVYMNQGMYKKAKEEFDLILKSLVYDQQYKTHYNLGILAFRQNNMNLAIKELRQSLGINENYCPSHAKLGEIYNRLKNYKASLKYYLSGTEGVCYSLFPPTKELIILLTRLGMYKRAELKISDAKDRFTKEDEKEELKKLQKYLELKIRRSI